MDVGPRRRLSHVGHALEDLEAVYNFGADLTVLSWLIRGAEDGRDVREMAWDLGGSFRPSSNQLRRLAARLYAEQYDPHAVIVDWWLGLPGRGQPRLVTHPVTISATYQNPIAVVIGTVLLVAQGIVWTVGKVQEAQAREAARKKLRAEERKLSAETIGLHLDNLKKVQDIVGPLVLTHALVRDGVPGLPEELVEVIALSNEGQSATHSIGRLPQVTGSTEGSDE